VTDQKPIRKDRVAIAVLVVLAAILLPILIRSGGSHQQPPPVRSTTETTLPSTSPVTTTPVDVQTPSTTAESSTGPTAASSSQNGVILTHKVVSGDTLSRIASDLGVTTAQLMADNRLLSATQLAVGITLEAVRGGILHTIEAGQTLTDISKTYGVTIDAITQANHISDPAKIYAGETIIIPGASADLWQTVIKLSYGQKSEFIWPAIGKVLSGFGWRTNPVLKTWEHHNGIDIDVPTGTIVHAAAPGKVYFAGQDKDLSGYGTLVILQNANGYYSFYGHLSKVLVYVGQFVQEGQPIAESGDTGVSTGPHLHFEIRNGEFPVDPMRYLPSTS
jgi:murein DD-endopeptidase MepM/ murein hydrolase activator NlpD